MKSFPFAQVRTHEDAALTHVGADLEQVATLAEFVLTGEEPVEQLLVDGPEPTLNRLERGRPRQVGVGVSCGGSHVDARRGVEIREFPFGNSDAWVLAGSGFRSPSR